jgi:aspartate-semialdehyde dehydrogenase
MDPEVPLVVPEVNLEAARTRPKGIVANPNCSTIQMVVALKPIHDAAKIRRVIVSTYQAVSGAGAKAAEALRSQNRAAADGQPVEAGAIGARLSGNLLMTWKPEAGTGYSEEELKMVRETKKILADDSIRISPTTVRVPVDTAHSESVTLECERPISAAEVRRLLERAPGVELMDDFERGVYPQPVHAAGRDPVLVGRIRDDVGNPGGVQLWIVSDNLRKGAALNAVQIAEGLLGS